MLEEKLDILNMKSAVLQDCYPKQQIQNVHKPVLKSQLSQLRNALSKVDVLWEHFNKIGLNFLDEKPKN